MSPKKSATLNIILALVFAVAIIIASLLIDDPKKAQIATSIILVLWFVPSSYITGKGARNKDKKDQEEA